MQKIIEVVIFIMIILFVIACEKKDSENENNQEPEIAWKALYQDNPGHLITHYHYSEGFLTGFTIYQSFEVKNSSGVIEISVIDKTKKFDVVEGESYQLVVDMTITTSTSSMGFFGEEITISTPSCEDVAKRVINTPMVSSYGTPEGNASIASKKVTDMALKQWNLSQSSFPLEDLDIEGSKLYYDSHQRPSEIKTNSGDLLKLWIYNDNPQRKEITYEFEDKKISYTVGAGGRWYSEIYFEKYKEITYYNYNKPVLTVREGHK